jgi:hypothetical protein
MGCPVIISTTSEVYGKVIPFPMLFILVMDVLGHMITKAANEGLLLPLSTRALQHCISIYADDVALFLRPEAGDISTIWISLIFSERLLGSRQIYRKVMCCQLGVVSWSLLPYPLSDFPCKYLGVPLSLRKLTKEQCNPLSTALQINFLAGRQT